MFVFESIDVFGLGIDFVIQLQHADLLAYTKSINKQRVYIKHADLGGASCHSNKMQKI